MRFSFPSPSLCSCRRNDVDEQHPPANKRIGRDLTESATVVTPEKKAKFNKNGGTPVIEFSKADEADSLVLPHAWGALIAQSGIADEQVGAHDVDFEVFGEEEADEDFDAEHAASGPTFSEAWQDFKAQEEIGFGKLREYVAANYPALLRKVLSPDRETYSLEQLGPRAFTFRGRPVRREDFAVKNERGFDLSCSVWRNGGDERPTTPKKKRAVKNNWDRGDLVRCRREVAQMRNQWLVGTVSTSGRRKVTVDFGRGIYTDDFAHSDLERVVKRSYCVVYIHDVGGSRLAALSSLGVALDSGVTGYCAFDTTACGHSSGRHISFGSFERFDLACVIAELVRDRGFTDVILWGRGAGAVAATMYCKLACPKPKEKSSSYSSWFMEEEAPSKSASGFFKEYAETKTVTLDVTQGQATHGDVRKRTKLAESFLDGLVVEPLTMLWAFSKPPLQIVTVKPGSLAAKCGARPLDLISGVSSSTRLPHTLEEFAELTKHAAQRPRSALSVHVIRQGEEEQDLLLLLPLVPPLAVILDCVIDSPGELLEALRVHALDREPLLVTLLEPLLSSAMDLLYHSVSKRANFDPSTIRLRDVTKEIATDLPSLFAINDFYDLDRGVPNLVAATRVVYDAYPGTRKQLVRYNAPLRLALRGTLDAMSSKFLNSCFVFIRKVTNQAQPPKDNEPPRWVVTTRPWAHIETREWQETIDDYEGAQDTQRDTLKLRKNASPGASPNKRPH